MTNDGLLELWETGAHRFLLPKKGKGGGIVAEEDDALGRLERVECLTDLIEVGGPQLLPLRAFGGPGVGFESRKCDE